MIELKPCPFCGGNSIVMHDVSGMFGKSKYARLYHYMQCRDCFAQTGYQGRNLKRSKLGTGGQNMRPIDADALQRRICGAQCGCEYEDCVNEGDCLFDHFIFWSHTLDVAPVVHGRWIGLEYDGYADGFPVYDLWGCSVCEEEQRGEDVPDTHLYCPNCGARMDKEGNTDG